MAFTVGRRKGGPAARGPSQIATVTGLCKPRADERPLPAGLVRI